MKRLADLIAGIASDAPVPEVDILDITCDSRRAGPGTLYFAWRGTKEDGHAYVDDAVAQGCAAVVAERPLQVPIPSFVAADGRRAFADAAARFHDDPTTRLNVVGVTGTNGKTTTTWILRSIFEAAGERPGLIGTVEYRTPLRIAPAKETTPASDRLQALFAEVARAGGRSCAMEVSSHALAQGRVHGVRFAAAVFTNLTRDHLDYHGSMKEYLAAKRSLFEMLPGRGVAAINHDDPAASAMAERTKARVVSFGQSPKCLVSAKIQGASLDGTDFVVRMNGDELPVRTRLIGPHNVSNILGAAAVTWGMGYDLEAIRTGIEQCAHVPGRLERVDSGGGGPVVLVDYAHTDDALRRVLTALRPLVYGRLIVVFGCGGDRDRGKRPLMGRAAEEGSDLFILTSDNPRSEAPLDIIREIESGLSSRSRYAVEPDREQAIRKAIALAAEGDAVLIAGKGHETTQTIGPDVRPFDDREVAKRHLKQFERR